MLLRWAQITKAPIVTENHTSVRPPRCGVNATRNGSKKAVISEPSDTYPL
ncbi:uncharacterized protein METZ01_LOCUS113636, partial [marine metagenome]